MSISVSRLLRPQHGNLAAFAILLASVFVGTGVEAASVSIMSYNVHNVFDAKHDINKDDYTFLPLDQKTPGSDALAYCQAQRNSRYREECLTLNWTDDKVEQKLARVAEMISSFRDGNCPDVVILQEVENKALLERLNQKHLSRCKYREAVLIEGPDHRGIDIGMLSRFRQTTAAKLHEVDVSRIDQDVALRGILEVTFSISGKAVSFFGNHWPVQANRSGAIGYASKNVLLQRLRQLPQEAIAVIAGDFNMAFSDPNASLEMYLMGRDSRPLVSDPYRDCELATARPCVPARGSYFYPSDQLWEFLDRIAVTPSLTTLPGFVANSAAFRVYAPSFALMSVPDKKSSGNELHVPKPFNPVLSEGYSDHFPVTLTFETAE